MRQLLDSIITHLKDGKSLVLVGVIASSGSTPRGAGALMAVFSDASFTGTIGGGAVEFEAQKQAALLFGTGKPHIASYTLAKNDVADLGMICGGDVTIYYDFIDASVARNLELFSYMRGSLDRDENAWIVKRFENGIPTETTVFDSHGLHFSVVSEESDILPLLTAVPELTDGEIQYYTEPLVRAGRVYVFGGGHVAQQLVPVLARVGFSVVVYEDRENYAQTSLFPDAADIILHDFTRISDKLDLKATDYVVIMTRGHQKDYDVLEQTLRTEAGYVGCIGSSKKIANTKQRLMAAGISEAALNRLHSPIGLKIKAETPAEIAVSIAAEMILFRAQYGNSTR